MGWRAFRLGLRGLVAGALLTGGAAAIAQTTRALPYWVSLSAGDALMRAGPGRQYPSAWRYRRAGLPLKVVAIHESWRKVRDPDGTEGWMAAALLGDQRTGMILGGIRMLRAAPDTAATILFRAEPGVVGRVRHCTAGWCEFDVRGQVGYVETGALWGVEAGDQPD